ncbi:MAG: hypothetical protein OIN85_05665 [Candidatus Methanoperedens sp.]|nr:hypothetical protein [Candidatus Methanoperedens sp.]
MTQIHADYPVENHPQIAQIFAESKLQSKAIAKLSFWSTYTVSVCTLTPIR